MKNEIIRIRFDEYNVADASRLTRGLRDSILQSVPDALIHLEQDPHRSSDDIFATIMVVVTTEQSLDRLKEALQWWRHRNVEAKVTVDGDAEGASLS